MSRPPQSPPGPSFHPPHPPRGVLALLTAPVILLAGLGGWALHGERQRAVSSLRREAENWADLAHARLTGPEWDAASGLTETARGSAAFAGYLVAPHCFRPPDSPDPGPPDSPHSLTARYTALRDQIHQPPAENPTAATGATAALQAELDDLLQNTALPRALTLSGLPLEPLVLHLKMESAPANERTPASSRLARAAARQPSEISTRLAADALPFLPKSEAAEALARAETAQQVWRDLESTRGTWERTPSGKLLSTDPRWQFWRVSLTDPPSPENRASTGNPPRPAAAAAAWWAGDTMVRLLSPEMLTAFATRVERTLRPDLPEAFTLVIGTAADVPLPSESLVTRTGGEFPLAIVLTDPGSLTREAARRTLWLAALLGITLAAAALAAWAAWRAFRRQVELQRLQTDFVASVSHELRTPVASISVMAERLDTGKVHDPAQAAQYHNFIAREGRRLADLVDNVLDFSRIGRGLKSYQREPADLPRLVQSACALLRPAAQEKNQTLTEEITLTDHDPAPDVDPTALRRALTNLLDNAIKFTPEGGRITVALEPDAHGGVFLTVTDNGPGIPPAERGHVFERFYRADNGLRREPTGAGIGLSLVQHIVASHGGTVEIHDAHPGTTFKIHLPAHSEKSE